MSLLLTCKETGNFTPCPEGIHNAVCLDVIEMGLMASSYEGQTRMVEKLRVVFEVEARMEDGHPFIVSKTFTLSMHPKAGLNKFLSKWRGRPVLDGESIDLSKVLNSCAVLMVSHQKNTMGRTYASIDAVSKPTKRMLPSGCYDPIAARQRLAEWKGKQQTGVALVSAAPLQVPVPGAPVPKPAPLPAAPVAVTPKAAPEVVEDNIPFDPEVGF